MVYTVITAIVLTTAAALAYFLGRKSMANSGQNRDIEHLQQLNQSLRDTLSEREARIEQQIIQINTLSSEREALSAVAENIRQQLRERIEEHKQQMSDATASHNAQIESLKAESQRSVEQQMKELKLSYEQQLKLLKESSENLVEQVRQMNKAQVDGQLKLIQEQMQTTSEKILKARQEELGASNMEQVSKIVDPLRESLKRMNEALDNSKREHLDSMTRLDTTIRENMKNSKELGQTAERLAHALTAEVKVQGNFGELKLKKLFEDLGLEEGTHYTTQQALRDKYGNKIKGSEDKNLIPDFILHFPNNRDVIVDSKVNLTAYEQYINCEDSDQKSRYLADHIKAVRKQVDNLANKDYSGYLDAKYTRLNFVIMYMFQESALNLALFNDTGLWRYAYDKGVLILGPQTMYMNLRILELMWVQTRQLVKQKDIIKNAELMIARVQDFAAHLNQTENKMQEALKSFQTLKDDTQSGGHTIITSARTVINLGVQQNKKKVDLTSIFVDEDESTLLLEPESTSETQNSVS